MSMEIKSVVMPVDNFPTKWQTVIFRNYGLVNIERIARVLGCDPKTVEAEAIRLGISRTPYIEKWESAGYITIIRNNWFVLPKDQLIELLGFTEERYEFVLKEEDFLGIKLGSFKPECPPVRYYPLSEGEISATEKIRKSIEKFNVYPTSMPFDFSFEKSYGPFPLVDNGRNIFAHGYLTPCGDVFETDSENYLPDSLLKKYSESGIKGLWLHGVLSKLSYFPFDPSLSKGYEERRRKFADMIERAAKFGIKIYMYFDEPRAVTKEIADKYPNIIGTHIQEDDPKLQELRGYSLCLETEEVREYLYTAVKELLSECNIGGILSITMSEYQTHCYSHTVCNCPRCKNKVAMPDSAVRVNNIIQKAIDDSGADTELIAFMWGWNQHRGWSHDDVIHALDTLDKKISVLSVSESMKPIKIGGIEGRVDD